MSEDQNKIIRMFLVTGEPFASMVKEYRAKMDERSDAMIAFAKENDFSEIFINRLTGAATGVRPNDFHNRIDNPPPGWKKVGKSSEPYWVPHIKARNKEHRAEGIRFEEMLSKLPRFPSSEAIRKAAGIPSDVNWKAPGGKWGMEAAGRWWARNSNCGVYWLGDEWNFITGPNTDDQIERILREHPDAEFSEGRYPDPVPAGLQRISWEEYDLYQARHKVAEYERKQKALAEGQPFEDEGEL